jgi:hypothetical protein
MAIPDHLERFRTSLGQDALSVKNPRLTASHVCRYYGKWHIPSSLDVQKTEPEPETLQEGKTICKNNDKTEAR